MAKLLNQFKKNVTFQVCKNVRRILRINKCASVCTNDVSDRLVIC